MDNFKDITVALGHYPIMGAILSVSQIAFAYLVTFNIELPTIFMQLFQLGAWLGAMLVAVVTVIGWLRTNTNLLDKWKWLKEKK